MAKEGVSQIQSGDPRNADIDIDIAPMGSQKQWERVQRYIRTSQEEGARL